MLLGKRLKAWWELPSGGREALVIALPLMISTASWTVMHFTDRLLLLWYSPAALAASLPAGLLSFVSIGFFMGVASYVNAFVSQYYGAQRHRRIGLAVWQGVWLGGGCTPLVLACLAVAPSFFAATGHEPEVIEQEIVYFRILCYGAPSMVVAAALSSFFTGRGNVRVVMVVDSAASGLNILLDYLWIFGYWGFPEGGIAGAGWATVIAQWIKVPVYLGLMWSAGHRRAFGTFSGCRFDLPLFARLIRFGSPNGLQMLLEVGAFTVFVFLVGKLGPLDLQATNLAISINTLGFIPVFGIGIATTTMVGQRLGENRPDLAARATWTTLHLATLYTAAIGALYVFAPGFFLALHAAQADPAQFEELRRLTVVLLRFVALYALADMANVIFVSAIKGAGDTRFVLITSLWTAAVMCAACYCGVAWWGWGVLSAWTALTVWIFALGAVYCARFLQGKWRTMRVIEAAVFPEPIGARHDDLRRDPEAGVVAAAGLAADEVAVDDAAAGKWT